MRSGSVSCEESRASRAWLRYAGVISFLVFWLTGLPARGQSTPLWRGLLRNSAGKPVAGATIRLTGQDSQAQSVTSSDGYFRLALPAGQYRLTVLTGRTKVEYSGPINVGENNAAVVLTLSERGELTAAISNGDQATGGEEL
ncbi:MAG TPA: carboxypeptidase-like regulatory domain-containing protein, partial [Candidatus Acidoferrum sp.]|nr:carboxypeptidase-like regulatory domain-containing protein [Candidatus Acidoferrum sp.]